MNNLDPFEVPPSWLEPNGWKLVVSSETQRRADAWDRYHARQKVLRSALEIVGYLAVGIGIASIIVGGCR